MYLLLAFFVFIAFLKVSSGSFADANLPGADVAEKAARNQMPLAQMYRCFAEMNCKMGEEVRNKVFNCYHKASVEEITEWCNWFSECPVGSFTFPTIEENVELFCELSYDEQGTFGTFFKESALPKFDAVCEEDIGSDKCKHLKKARNCLGYLIAEHTYSGECGKAEEKAEE